MIECAAQPLWRIEGTKGDSYSTETEQKDAAGGDDDADDDARGEGEVNTDLDLIRR